MAGTLLRDQVAGGLEELAGSWGIVAGRLGRSLAIRIVQRSKVAFHRATAGGHCKQRVDVLEESDVVSDGEIGEEVETVDQQKLKAAWEDGEAVRR